MIERQCLSGGGLGDVLGFHQRWLAHRIISLTSSIVSLGFDSMPALGVSIKGL